LPPKYAAIGYSDTVPAMAGGVEGKLNLLAEELKK